MVRTKLIKGTRIEDFERSLKTALELSERHNLPDPAIGQVFVAIDDGNRQRICLLLTWYFPTEFYFDREKFNMFFSY